MTDRELLEKIVTQVGTMTNQVGTLTNQVDGLHNDIKGVKDEMQNMQNDIKGVQYEMQNMQNDIKGVKDEMQNVQNDIKGVKNEMQEGFREAYLERQEIKMTLENETNKNIKIIAEGQQYLNNKIDEVLKFQDEKEMLIIRIEIVENELNRLKARLDVIA